MAGGPAWLDSPGLKKTYKRFLPIGFAVAVLWALIWPAPGDHAAHWISNGWKILSTINMCIIFFLFGISLETKELKSAFGAVKALSLGTVTILVLTSFLGYIPLRIPLKPYEFSLGMAIFSCVPTSLSSGVTLVIQGYGNGALALVFTVLTNLLGIVTAPIFVKMILGGNITVDAIGLLKKLSVSILMPLAVGKALREAFPVVGVIAKVWKLPLGMLNSLQIIVIVWQTLSSSQSVLMEQEIFDIFIAIFAAVVQHICFLFFTLLLSFIVALPDKERKAYVIMASQKALPVAAVIILQLDPAQVGSLGLIAMPCIVFYVLQLFIDSYICNAWASKYENRAAVIEQRYANQLKRLETLEALEAAMGITWTATWHPVSSGASLEAVKVGLGGGDKESLIAKAADSASAAWRA